MPTDPNKINVTRIDLVSDDENSSGKNELLTAAAVQRIRYAVNGVLPTIIPLSPASLDAGIFTYEHNSGLPVLYVVVFDNNGDEVLLSPFFDPNGVYFNIDFSDITDVTDWVVSVWIVPPSQEGDGVSEENTIDFYRAYSPDPVDLKTDAIITILDVPADRSFVVDDFSVILRSMYGVSTPAKVTLYIQDGDILVNNQPINLPAVHTRQFFDIKPVRPAIVPPGKKLYVRISEPGIATGAYSALFNVAGYFVLDDIVEPPSSSSSSSSSSTSSSSSSSSSTSSSSSSSSSTSSSSSSSSTSSSSSSSSSTSSSSSSSSTSSSSSSSSTSSALLTCPADMSGCVFTVTLSGFNDGCCDAGSFNQSYSIWTAFPEVITVMGLDGNVYGELYCYAGMSYWSFEFRCSNSGDGWVQFTAPNTTGCPPTTGWTLQSAVCIGTSGALTLQY